MFVEIPADVAQPLKDLCAANKIVLPPIDPKKCSLDDCTILIQGITTLLSSSVSYDEMISRSYGKILLLVCNLLREVINQRPDRELTQEMSTLFPNRTTEINQLSMQELRIQYLYLSMIAIMFNLESTDQTLRVSLIEYALSKFSHKKRSQVCKDFLIPIDHLLSRLSTSSEQLYVVTPSAKLLAESMKQVVSSSSDSSSLSPAEITPSLVNVDQQHKPSLR